jgi:hypothetical protein
MRWATPPAVAVLLLAARAISGDDVRTVTIFQGRQIALAVPAGWKFDEELDPHHGTPTLHVEDPQGDVALALSFFPDPADGQPNRADLEAEARSLFEPYLDSAVEKDMSLTYFEAPDGSGVYASFTDGNLDPQNLPEDEKLISTAGLRSMKGVYVLFVVLTNSRNSASYRRALELVRGEMRQVKTPVSF